MLLEARHPAPETKPQMISQRSAQQELELQKLYELWKEERDLLMAETTEIRSPVTRQTLQPREGSSLGQC